MVLMARKFVTSVGPALLPQWVREQGRKGGWVDLLTLIGNEQIKGSARWQVINQASNQRWQLSIKALFQYTPSLGCEIIFRLEEKSFPETEGEGEKENRLNPNDGTFSILLY